MKATEEEMEAAAVLNEAQQEMVKQHDADILRLSAEYDTMEKGLRLRSQRVTDLTACLSQIRTAAKNGDYKDIIAVCDEALKEE